ncbi:MAG: hypothetical protein QOF78_482 [Phycisphaerales bacterium]|nr:hypothetical protein [Phycisphaerales bacterium]
MSSGYRSRALANASGLELHPVRPRPRRHGRAVVRLMLASVAPVVAVVLAPADALAVQKVFLSANQAWLTTTNWTPTGLPTASDDILVNGGNLDMTMSAGNITAQYITYTNPLSRSLGNQTGLATNSNLTLVGSGANPLISVTGAGTFNIRGPNIGAGTGVLNLVLGGSGDLNVAGPGPLIIGSVISETGGPRSLTKTGAGGLTLLGANTFTGDFTIRSGTVSVSTIANAGTAQGMGMALTAVGIGDASTAATLSYSGASTTTDRAFVLGAAGATIATTNELSLTSAVTGTGALTKSGVGSLTLTGANGALSATSAVTINAGTLRLSNQIGVNNNNRINDAASITLNGGVLRIDMDLGAPTTEVAGALQIAGGANAVRSFTGGTGSIGTMTFNSISRSAGVVAFEPSASTTFGIVTTPSLPNGILGGWATYNSTDWATIDAGTGNVVAYSGYNTSADSTTWLATDNVSTNVAATVAANKTINSLRVSGSGVPITIDAGATLNVTDGILAVGATHSIGGGGSLTAGSAAGHEMIVTTPDAAHDLTVSVPIVNNAGGALRVTKAGAGVLVLDGANTYTGSTDILAGTVRLGAAGDLSASAVNVSAGSVLDVNNQIKTVGSLAGAGSVTLGSGTLSAGINGGSTTYGGIISGAGNITKVGTGTMALTGVNTFTGVTNVGNTNGIDAGGVLVVDADSRFGAAPAAATPGKINIYNGTLRLTNGVAPTGVITSGGAAGLQGVLVNINRGVTLNAGGGKIEVPTGQYAEIAGIIADGASGTSPLHKIGGGILDLRTANNTFTGGVIVDAGVLGVNKDSNFGGVPATFDADAVQLNNGATIRWYSNSSLVGLNANRGLTIGSGGGIIDWSHSSGVPLINHPITSAAGNTLTKTGTNTVQSNIAQPSMNGDLVVNQGRWNAHNNTAAGNGTIYLSAPDISPATAAGVAQLGIGGTNLGLTITMANNIVLNPTGQGISSFEVNNSTPTQNTLILNGNITGTGGLTKGRVAATNGTLVLGGNNSYSGDTTILLGTVRTTGGSAIPDTSAVVIGDPISGSIATLDVAASETIGNLSGGGAVRGNVVIGAGQTLTVNETGNTTFTGIISGNSLAKSGAGTLTLIAANTYSGVTSVNDGILSVGASNNLGNNGATNDLALGTGGTLQLTGAVNSVGRDVTVNAGGGTIATTTVNSSDLGFVDGSASFTKSGPGSLSVRHVRTGGASLTVSDGTLVIGQDSFADGVSNVGALNLPAGARLDLRDNKLITTNPAGNADINGVYSGIQGEVQRASNGGAWDSPGLTTSMSDAATGLTTIGVATGEQLRGLGPTDTDIFAGQTITGASTIAMYTYAGDANMDGFISGDDYSTIDFNVGTGADGYSNGDFNYDGIVSGDDYSTIDFNYAAQGAPFFTSGSAGLSGVTAVPEPAACGLVALAAALVGRRRRRGV